MTPDGSFSTLVPRVPKDPWTRRSFYTDDDLCEWFRLSLPLYGTAGKGRQEDRDRTWKVTSLTFPSVHYTLYSPDPSLGTLF